MIRVILFLAFVAVLALGAVWIADRPGDVSIVWQGYRIETSIAVLIAAIAVVIMVALVLWSVIRVILRSPDLIALFLSHRRGVRGYLAISRGLVAIGAGDARAARRFADEAGKIAPGEPLTLLLNAQCAQLAGDRATAEASFRAMAARDDTKLLGLRGLYIEAQRRDDPVAARNYADEAAQSSPSLSWAGQAALEYRCAAGDWTGAQAALDRNYKAGLIDRAQYRRQRAVLLTARALAAEDSDRDQARALALDAVKLAPDLVPAAELAGRLLGEAGETRRAGRILEAAWRANPHPDLADTYAALRVSDTAPERLARVEALARRTPGHLEGALAVARAAIDARQFAVARGALQPLLKQPTQRVAELMAEIEHHENDDESRAREWMTRALHAPRGPIWTADGHVSDRWMPVSPVSGRLDAFQWRVPLAELGAPAAVIEVSDAPAPASTPVRPLPPPAVPAPEAKPLERSEPPAVPAPPPRDTAKPMPVEAVIPLVHVPDDPGPDGASLADPEPAPTSGGPRRGLFS
jgi:HemY protein